MVLMVACHPQDRLLFYQTRTILTTPKTIQVHSASRQLVANYSIKNTLIHCNGTTHFPDWLRSPDQSSQSPSSGNSPHDTVTGNSMFVHFRPSNLPRKSAEELAKHRKEVKRLNALYRKKLERKAKEKARQRQKFRILSTFLEFSDVICTQDMEREQQRRKRLSELKR
eukprot:765537_1